MSVTQTLLASAARTASAGPQIPAVQQVSQNLTLTLNVTVASGTGGLTPVVQWQDPTYTGAFQPAPITLLTCPTVTSTGTYTYTIGPGASLAPTGGTAVLDSTLPQAGVTVTVNHGDASSYTYSLTATQN
jgi:hypothetical protein